MEISRIAKKEDNIGNGLPTPRGLWKCSRMSCLKSKNLYKNRRNLAGIDEILQKSAKKNLPNSTKIEVSCKNWRKITKCGKKVYKIGISKSFDDKK